MTEHSIFPPSGLPRGIICPASVNLQGTTEPNRFMAEGTICHKISEFHLTQNMPWESVLGTKMESDGFKIEITEELVDLAKVYCDVCKNYAGKYPDAEFLVEHRVDMGFIGEDYEEIFGTADCIIRDLFNILVVIDLKSGKGNSVSADADQLKMYAVMAAGDLLETYEKVVTVVVQPRDPFGDTVKIAKHDPDDLLKWRDEILLPAIDASRSEDAAFVASKEGCRWCNYKGRCKAQAEHALSIATEDFGSIGEMASPVMIDPRELDSDSMSTILGRLDFFENWLKSVREAALNRMVNGGEIPGFKLVESQTRRRWNPDVDVEHILRKEIKLRKMDIMCDKLKTPNQVLEAAKNDKLKTQRIKELIIKPEGGPVIVPVEDKRKSLEIKQFTFEDDFKLI